jgi:hypothetical protein
MTSVVVDTPDALRSLTIEVAYGSPDVESAADSVDVVLCDEEVECILANIDAELPELAAAATRSAVAVRTLELIRKASHSHGCSEDD